MPEASAEFVAAMEDVLDLYAQDAAAPDPTRPLVCLDEKPVVLHAETRPSVPPEPGVHGHPERRDYEYQRQGTADLFVLVAPHLGWRHVAVTAQRTRRDYAEQLRYLAEEAFPHAECIRLVQDNLNTHTLAALYDVFPPARARAIASRFELHFTPKHGSWLDMAEIEISVFERGCLSRPVPDRGILANRVAALEVERNRDHRCIHWQFTSQDARTKLAHLYPVQQTNLD